MSAHAPLFNMDRYRQHLRRARRTYGQAETFKQLVADDFAERIALINRPFDLALDLGCRTGAMARALEACPDAQAKIKTLIQADWVADFTPDQDLVLDPDHFALKDEQFHLILAGLSLHVINDLPGALIQIRRALRPDGLFLGAVYGPNTLQEWRDSLMTAELELTGGAAQRFAPLIDVRDLGSLLQRAGLALPVTDIDTHVVRYDHPLAVLQDLRHLGETLMLSTSPAPLKKAVLVRAVEIYQDRYTDSDGRVRATLEIVTASGWAPHDSQQKPLRPGEADISLAEALRTQN